MNMNNNIVLLMNYECHNTHRLPAILFCSISTHVLFYVQVLEKEKYYMSEIHRSSFSFLLKLNLTWCVSPLDQEKQGR